jgi:hypothetical protein
VECAFLGRSAVAIGTAGWGRDGIDVARERVPSAVADEGFAKLASPPRPFVLWVAARFDDRQRRELVGTFGAEVSELTFGLDLESDLVARLHVDAASERDATALEERVVRLLDLARRDARVGRLGLASLVDRVGVAAHGPTVDMSIQLSQTALDEVVASLERASKRDQERRRPLPK